MTARRLKKECEKTKGWLDIFELQIDIGRAIEQAEADLLGYSGLARFARP